MVFFGRMITAQTSRFSSFYHKRATHASLFDMQFIPLEGPRDKFTTAEDAKMNIIEEAKKVIDTRI